METPTSTFNRFAVPDEKGSIAAGTELEVLTLVNEMTQKVLIRQPRNIYQFCAELLEDKLKDREATSRKEERKARQREKKMKKVSLPSTACPSQSVMDKLTLGVTSGMQENDPLREQVTVSAVGGRGPCIPAIQADFSVEPEVISLNGHQGEVTQCCFFADYVLTSSLDCTLRVWKKETGEHVQKMECEKPIHNFVLTSEKDKKVIFAACDDGKLVAWRLKISGSTIKSKCTNVVPCHQPNPIRAIAASPNGKLLATGCCFHMFQIRNENCRKYEVSVRGTLKIWKLTDLLDWALHPNRSYHDITFEAMRTMKQLVINSQATQIKRGNSGLVDSHYGIRTVCFSPDSKVVAVGFGTPAGNSVQDVRMVALCEADSLETLWVQEHMDYQTNGLSFSHIGSGTFQAPWELFISSQQGIGKISLFLSGDTQQRVTLRDLWKETFDEEHHGMCVAPNARLIASVLGGALHIRDSTSGQNIGIYSGHEQPVLQLAFCKDARVICTVSKDHSAKLWKFVSAKKKCDVLINIDEYLPSKGVIPPISSTLNGHASSLMDASLISTAIKST